LVCCALAAALPMRAGVANIGGEGQFLLGAVFAAGLATTWRLGGGQVIDGGLVLCGAMLAGAGWALIAGWLERARAVPVVLATILLNFIALYLMRWLVAGPLHDAATQAPQTAVIPADLRLPSLVPMTRLHGGIAVAVLLAGAAWIWARWSVIGFELRACGLNPDAAREAGIPVARRRWQALTIGGALAGLGGGLHVLGALGEVSEGTRSFGYLGVAVALLGRLDALGILAAAVFFSVLDAGARAVEYSGQGVPRDLADVVKGVVVLAMLLATAWLARRQTRQDAAT
jgi:simple sugar transport system permease protein